MAEVKHENFDNYSAAFPSGLAYYCDLYRVRLSSDETMIAHKQGKKHLKKQKSFQICKFLRDVSAQMQVFSKSRLKTQANVTPMDAIFEGCLRRELNVRRKNIEKK